MGLGQSRLLTICQGRRPIQTPIPASTTRVWPRIGTHSPDLPSSPILPITGSNNLGNTSAASPANAKSSSAAAAACPAASASRLTVTTLVWPRVRARSANPAAGYTTELVPTTSTMSTGSDGPRAIHASISSSMVPSRASPNQTTPGRCRPVRHCGQRGRAERGMRGSGWFGSSNGRGLSDGSGGSWDAAERASQRGSA
ncbi:hypothetical protein VTK56DRAFT_2912 [Thermocarpiscus australiensis]